MPKDNESIFPFDGPVAPSEPQGFAAEEMIRCEECLRANPPTRVNCLYCAATLPLTETSVRLRKPSLRPPEKHQRGYNNIILPREHEALQEQNPDEIANLLKLEPDCVDRIMAANRPLPLARTASSQEAQLVLERLEDLGVRSLMLSDDDLGLSENCVSRVRLMRFADQLLELQQSSAEPVAFSWSEVLLIVSGRLFVKRVEVNERKSRKAEKEIVRSSQYFTDEAVVDIYLSTSSQTWRVAANGFDFSCLGPEKALVASENIARLVKLIVERASNARLDDSYSTLRQTLDPVWRAVQETESKGWRREGPGKFSLGAATIDSNETQFTRYSRLNYYFAKHPAN